MTAYPFLSPDWIAAVTAIREEYEDRAGITEIAIRANVTVTEAPFDEPTIHGHVDTTAGALVLEVGHHHEPDFSLELHYDVAHQIFVDRDPQAMMMILVSGQVKLTGDSSKILGLAGMAAPQDVDSETVLLARELISRIDAITS